MASGSINIDLHCDLLSYYLHPDHEGKDIGCSPEYLRQGNVGFQIMAIYSSTETGSTDYAAKQIEIYQKLLQRDNFYQVKAGNIGELNSEKTGIAASIENASCFTEENEPLENGLRRLEYFVSQISPIAYIGFTHHTENRFGGGNFSEIGLKEDGKILLDFLADKNIPVDFSHTSDALAYEILNYIDTKGYNTKILASHSNCRNICKHPRNLPDELITEIISRNGIIGLNFVKDFINRNSPDDLYRHIESFLKLGAENHICYGADFFFDAAHPDKSRYPFFFDEFKNAAAYPTINEKISQLFSQEVAEKISHQNAQRFYGRLWTEKN